MVYLQPSGLQEKENEGSPITVSDLLSPYQKELSKECGFPLLTVDSR